MMFNMLRELCALNATSGREKNVREYILSKLPSSAEAHTDRAGNLIVFKKGAKTPKNKVMLAAHMDEVGFIATSVDADGYIKFAAVGGIDPTVILGKKIIFDSGVRGVFGLTPVHLIESQDRKKMPKITDMYIDIGSRSREETLEHVKPGDTGVFVSEYIEFGENKIKSKALDDRVGCAVMLDMLSNELEFDTYFAFTVKEEVGLIGAKAAAFGIDPDYAIVLEATTAADIPEVGEGSTVCSLGGGAVVSFMDRATVYNPDLFKKALSIAEKNNIKAQVKTLVAGGNDAGAIHQSRAGVHTLTLNIPCRYIHSMSCVADKGDILSLRELAAAVLSDFCNE